MQGNSSSSKSARASKQLRDKNGRWIEMGGLVKYTNGSTVFTGEVVDIPTGPRYELDELVTLKVTTPDHKYFGQEIDVDAKKLEAVKQKADLDLDADSDVDSDVDSDTDSDVNSDSDDFDEDTWESKPKNIRDPEDEEYDEEDEFPAGPTVEPGKSWESRFTEISSPYTVTDPAFKDFVGYTLDEEMALADYANDYQAINGPLRRENNESTKKYNTSYHALMKLLDKSVIAEPVTVWRGLYASNERVKKMQKGGVYYDKAFTSTSSNPKIFKNVFNGGIGGIGFSAPKGKTPMELEIKLPAGFKAHKFDYDIQNRGLIGRFWGEEEVLLPPETLFKIISMDKIENGAGYRVVLEPIPTAQNSVGVETNEEEANRLIEENGKKPKKWGLFSLSAEELNIHSKLISSNGIVFEKISDQAWEYRTETSVISYSNNSIDSFKSVDSIDFDVETA